MIETETQHNNLELTDEGIYVMKFGGTSVGSALATEKTSKIIREERLKGKKIVMVASAIRGVTDSLVRLCTYLENERSENLELEIEDITANHNVVIHDLDLSASSKKAVEDKLSFYINSLRKACFVSGYSLETKDLIAGLGERMNCHIVSASLNSMGIDSEAVDATEIIETDNNFGNANPNFENTEIYSKRKLLTLLNAGVLPVVTGFVGATKDYKPTTLGRGGSDYTASILGRVLGAREVWIWTDVDGVYSSDPLKNPDAKIIPYLTFKQADCMARNGAKVLYEKTVEPLMETDIILRVKNTFNPGYCGTKISG